MIRLLICVYFGAIRWVLFFSPLSDVKSIFFPQLSLESKEEKNMSSILLVIKCILELCLVELVSLTCSHLNTGVNFIIMLVNIGVFLSRNLSFYYCASSTRGDNFSIIFLAIDLFINCFYLHTIC